jgi:hypothetical protein
VCDGGAHPPGRSEGGKRFDLGLVVCHRDGLGQPIQRIRSAVAKILWTTGMVLSLLIVAAISLQAVTLGEDRVDRAVS